MKVIAFLMLPAQIVFAAFGSLFCCSINIPQIAAEPGAQLLLEQCK